jgi:hypothetical protein
MGLGMCVQYKEKLSKLLLFYSRTSLLQANLIT